eukprot:NODE_8721_length_397_cov_93.278736_g7838_i0.p2 GENE.NODE_8721_length_397_cov_93.278736_g7838_i0~~NODE_8721_length_397_cov_93.278736_g7838_i0.p2  ORF type:complete len:86 (-),score=22.24 NODE_8721_length_397_cov_93.278736_g7838_i0:138-374(-)
MGGQAHDYPSHGRGWGQAFTAYSPGTVEQSQIPGPAAGDLPDRGVCAGCEHPIRYYEGLLRENDGIWHLSCIGSNHHY